MRKERQPSSFFVLGINVLTHSDVPENGKQAV